MMDIGHQLNGFICLIGNDCAGKSSVAEFNNQHLAVTIQDKSKQTQKWLCIQRSMLKDKNITQKSYWSIVQKNRKPISQLIQVIKTFDVLTYSYSFENDWYSLNLLSEIEINGLRLPVYWILLEVPVPVISQRIKRRLDITIYEHPKCIKYFNKVYKQMSYFYGIPSIQNSNKDVSETVLQLYDVIKNRINPKSMPSLLEITPQLILSETLNNKIQQAIVSQWAQQIKQSIFQKSIIPQIRDSFMNRFYQNYFISINHNLKDKIVAKWIQNNFKRQFKNNCLYLLKDNMKLQIDLSKYGYCFQEIIQGESKLIYKIVTPKQALLKYYQDKVLILLKGTIYSHTNQSTGEIRELPKIRAKGSMIFLEMLKRNHIDHSYISINHSGVILSEFVKVNNLQIVFKKEFLGTDKHSYLGLDALQTVCKQNQTNTQYKGGIYVRFDWRNPNHILLGHQKKWINSDPYYYIVEDHLGKEQFFKQFLCHQEKCKPVGDKCISQDLIKQYANTDRIKQMVIETYCTFQYYANQVGLQILDGCFMIDQSQQKIWSQINPDCLRVKAIQNRQNYDKDIWRIGGSSAKEMIIKKWQKFNEIFVEYFQTNRFMDSQLKQQKLMKQIYANKLLSQTLIRPGYQFYYQNIIRGNKRREVIGTIDLIKGSPILVQQSVFKQKHSHGQIMHAWDFIKIMPQIVVVDIDGAFGEQRNNFELINLLSRLKPNNIYGVGGGIRNIQKANHYFQTVGNIIISSNLDLINQVPEKLRKNIIVQLSVNQKDQVLTHARTINTHWKLIQKIRELCKIGIINISITFRNSQGKLSNFPRQQLKNIMYQMPGPIQKVIIAGGISSLDDLEYIWGFDKCVPQLGSAIWKHKISIGQIYSKLVRYDRSGLINAVIKSRNDIVLGMVHLNEEALLRTCQQRVLYRYSRQHKRLMKKGQQSGNIQLIQSINIDCDNDCLLITVTSQGQGNFCHMNNRSCFYNNKLQNDRKDIIALQQHILKSKQPGVGSGYSYRMQNKPQLAIHKTLEQFEQLSLAQNHELRLQQSADTLAHLIMYWNSQNIKINDILSIMNERSKKVITRANYQEKIKKTSPQINNIKIGIGLGKHTKFIHDFMEDKLGIKLIQNKEKQRCFKIVYEITDQEKACKALGVKQINQQNQIVFVSTKPKDMVKMMYKKLLNFGINYSNIISVYEDEIEKICDKQVNNLKLGLIKRKNEQICPQKWTTDKKGLIASEYPNELVKYFTKKGISSDNYTLLKVTGHSQGYLNDYRFDYCDAIVQSGKTIQQNNLELEAILVQQISVVLFKI